jgi:REP element-mobilizing transposase RayT
LKGTNTTDLNSIETQAFGYKNNQPECVYVITSNFEKLRFYIDNSIDYEEFNLFTLSREQFNLLYLCLSLPSIQQNLPKRLKDESVSQEDAITKKLYKDYSEFKRALYHNLVELNPEFDKLLLFKKTQKLLDRFLFIFFAEDRLLLPTNLIFRINQEWKNLMKMRMTVSLYERYKVYFNDLNVGAKVTLPAFGKKTGDAIEAEFEIFAYNGGLFAPDDLLDQVKINDEVLHVYTEKMSHYDFDSDVDVNILGHIFENSLNEIDEIKSEIEGETVDKTKTRRKKDGVFYTPKYITKYIVDNTVGKLCAEKKADLNLADEDYTNDKKIQTKTKKAHLDKLTDYRAWLLQLTICDPACGSGAFLNQALEFLIAEHRYVDELQAKLMGDSLILSDVETSILENNIYGVDLNDESVEIAKLSLWLRTAQKGRKLNSLNNNIKCGNSLIDDPEVAGDKAFSWEKEFPEVFKEKNKFPFHITTSLHDSRTSERMIKYQARERRFNGTKPDPEVFPMTKEEEELIATTVADIAKEDNLNIAAFNLCWDHMHILLVCEEEEVPKIMHKIKGRTARACNVLRNKGINPLDALRKDGSIPFWTQKYGCKPITSDDQFWNTYNYIENNKVKHNLTKNPKLEKIILGFVKTYEDCFKSEYIGGFDVVIGNPPYVLCQPSNTDEKTLIFYKTFEVASYKIDLFHLFFEKSIENLNENGILGFITPNTYLTNKYIKPLRNFILKSSSIEKLIIHEEAVFLDADVDVATIILNKKRKSNSSISIYKTLKNNFYSIGLKDQNEWDLDEDKIFNFNDEFSFDFSNCIKLGDVFNTYFGIQAYDRNSSISKEKIDDNFLPIIDGGEIVPYQYSIPSKFFNYINENIKSGGDWSVYSKERILVRQIGQIPVVGLCKENILASNTLYSIYPKNEHYHLYYLLIILNSKLLKSYWLSKYSDGKLLFPKIKGYQIKELPIKDISLSVQQPFIDKADSMLSLNKDFQALTQKLSTYICSQYHLEKLSGKLSAWYELDFSDFIKELNKAIKAVKGTPLSKKDEFEWMELFEENKQKALALKAEIDRTDKEIDQMVYELYGLTEEEIQIVSGATS